MQGKRNSTMDIVKAIGIISIVMGHCCYSIMIPALNVSVGEFVYSYHLMVFFFVAGFFYKREYHEHPEQYIGKRLLKLGGMLFLYNTVFTLLHNTLVSVKMISSTEHYSISKMVSCIVQSLLMKYTEELLGACWFLPMFFIGTALFAIAFSKAEKSKKPEYWHKIICILFAAGALYANSRELTWEYWIQTSILAVPIMYIGYFAKQKWDKLDKGITWYGTILSAAVGLQKYLAKIHIQKNFSHWSEKKAFTLWHCIFLDLRSWIVFIQQCMALQMLKKLENFHIQITVCTSVM